MLLMSNGLEDRIRSKDLANPEEKLKSTIVFKDGVFPCHLIRAEIDFANNKKILCIKSSFELINNIYNGWLPLGLVHAGEELRFEENMIERVVCEKTAGTKGPLAILTLEISK